MGRLFLLKLEGEMYTCKYCNSHIALSREIISKSFQCQNGKAYLFNKVVNVTLGEKEERMMITGLHTVMDICCVKCGSLLGWKYELAHENSQKYKEGKFVIERAKLLGPDGSGYPAAVQDIEMEGNDPEDEEP